MGGKNVNLDPFNEDFMLPPLVVKGDMFQMGKGTVITFSASGTDTKIGAMDAGELERVTLTTADTLTVSRRAFYFITWSISFTGGNVIIYEGGININSTRSTSGTARRELGAVDTGSMSSSTIKELQIDDEIQLVIRNTTNTTSATIQSAELVLYQISL